MKTKFIFFLYLLLTNTVGFCTTWTIANSGSTFTPSNITIAQGDDVVFNLESIHNALEVSQSTWSVNGNAPLAGGFHTAFGVATITSAHLTVGTHWYVCESHYFMGMKGMITVSSLGLPSSEFLTAISVFPNPTDGLITIKTSENLTNSAYSVADQWGRMVLKGNLNATDTITPLDISHLQSGIYFFQVGEVSRRTFKVVKR